MCFDGHPSTDSPLRVLLALLVAKRYGQRLLLRCVSGGVKPR